MPTCPRRASRSAGFTLIEMLVVLTVMGLLAGIVAARTGPASGGRYQAQSAEQTLRAAIADAVLTARRSGRPAAVAPGELVEGAALQPLLAAPRAGTLLFYPDGSSTGGLIAVKGRPILEVDWLTGEARDAG
jgi:prepilin-type N-terminal cleavage/methylation domain-containing protein